MLPQRTTMSILRPPAMVAGLGSGDAITTVDVFKATRDATEGVIVPTEKTNGTAGVNIL